MRLTVSRARFATRRPLVIARGTESVVETCHVGVEHDGRTGYGEAVGVDYRGETADGIAATLAGLSEALAAAGPEIAADTLLPAGARAALDAALVDLRAKRAGVRAATLFGVPPATALPSSWTINLGTPAAMAAEAAAMPAFASALKVKLGGPLAGDLERLGAVRAAQPAATLLIDVNGAWSIDELAAALPRLAAFEVALIEQPCAPGADGDLARLRSPILLCADESLQSSADLDALPGGYGAINIKLDKCGGPTDALRLARAAQARGLAVMAGSMLTTSLGIAPLFVLAGHARWFDIDAPTYLADDRSPALERDGWRFEPPAAELWG